MEEKASVCFGRNDKFAAVLMGGEPSITSSVEETYWLLC